MHRRGVTGRTGGASGVHPVCSATPGVGTILGSAPTMEPQGPVSDLPGRARTPEIRGSCLQCWSWLVAGVGFEPTTFGL